MKKLVSKMVDVFMIGRCIGEQSCKHCPSIHAQFRLDFLPESLLCNTPEVLDPCLCPLMCPDQGNVLTQHRDVT